MQDQIKPKLELLKISEDYGDSGDDISFELLHFRVSIHCRQA